MREKRSGPVEELKWTDTLKANVVTPGSLPRVHGYDVRGEMLGKFSFTGMIYLALTGELPSKTALAALERVLLFAAPVSAAEAPVHASILAGLCGSGPAGLTGVAGVTLAERARWMVSAHGELLSSLGEAGHIPIERFPAETHDEKKETSLLLESLKDAGVGFPPDFAGLSPDAVVLAVLYSCCGLTDPEVLEAVLVLAGMPCTLAEGRAVKPGDFRTYPIDLPEFRYCGDEK